MSSKTIWIRNWKLISFRFRCRSEFGIEICITLISILIWNRFLKSVWNRYYTDFNSEFKSVLKSVSIRYIPISDSVLAPNRFGIGIPNRLIGIPIVGIPFHHYLECSLFNVFTFVLKICWQDLVDGFELIYPLND